MTFDKANADFAAALAGHLRHRNDAVGVSPLAGNAYGDLLLAGKKYQEELTSIGEHLDRIFALRDTIRQATEEIEALQGVYREAAQANDRVEIERIGRRIAELHEASELAMTELREAVPDGE